jgi:hypothetical protein
MKWMRFSQMDGNYPSKWMKMDGWMRILAKRINSHPSHPKLKIF